MKNTLFKKIITLAITTILFSVWLNLSCNNVYAESISTDVLSEVDKYITAKMEELRIKGAAVGIVQGESIVYTKGYGVSNTKGDSVTPNTPFILGSTTKSITALAVMQLAEAGKIELDQPVKKYIPEFQVADKEASSHITVRHLLNQTSGIPGTAGNSDYLNDRSTPEDFLNRLSTLTLKSSPGKVYEYAEANYVILGVLISKVSGERYEEYIQKHIFTPLDMKNSFTSKDKAIKSGLSTGYRTCFGFPFPSDFPYPSQYVSASYLISSAEDMAHYLKMYLSSGNDNSTPVISGSGVEELFKPGPKLLHPAGYSYSMGWFVSDENKVHDGRPTNYYSCMVIDSKSNTGIVLLTNTNNRLVTAEYSMPIAMGVSNLINGKKVEEVSFGFRELYFVFNLIVIALIVSLLIRLVLSLTVFRRKLKNRTISRSWKDIRFTIPDIVMVIIFTGTFIYLLESMQIAFSIAMLGQPDMVIAFIAVITLSLLNLLVRSVLILSCSRRNVKQSKKSVNEC